MVRSSYPRFIAERVVAALRDTPVVAVVGARQAGKSTLVRDLVPLPRNATYVTLDDPVPLATARADPDGFIDAHDGPLVLDEAQRVPEIFRAIKRSVDRDRRPGRFLLTGSADILHLPRASESLAGRMEILTLWPLSQGELERRREVFVDRAFGDAAFQLASRGAEGRRRLVERILRGGFAGVVDRDPTRRAAWYDSYIATVLQREVSDIATIERAAELPMLARLLAARTGTVLNVAELTRATGIPHATLTRYLTLLDLAYVTMRASAWSGDVGRRLLKHPKVFATDSGLAAHLSAVDASSLDPDGRSLGHLVETFVAMELRKQLGWSRTRATLHHYRSVTGGEVDIVLERGDGALVGIEVKASETLEARDANGLRAFAETVGTRFHRGIVLYAGSRTIALGRSLHAIPVAALWAAS